MTFESGRIQSDNPNHDRKETTANIDFTDLMKSENKSGSGWQKDSRAENERAIGPEAQAAKLAKGLEQGMSLTDLDKTMMQMAKRGEEDELQKLVKMVNADLKKDDSDLRLDLSVKADPKNRPLSTFLFDYDLTLTQNGTPIEKDSCVGRAPNGMMN